MRSYWRAEALRLAVCPDAQWLDGAWCLHLFYCYVGACKAFVFELAVPWTRRDVVVISPVAARQIYSAQPWLCTVPRRTMLSMLIISFVSSLTGRHDNRDPGQRDQLLLRR